MGWIKDIHDIVVQYLPKPVSFEVEKEKSKGRNTINYRNTSGRSVEVVDIHINGINVNEHYPIGGLEIETSFVIHTNQRKSFWVYSDKDTEPPKTIQFYLKSTFGKVKKLEFSL
jgi:hypothetical protein